MTEPCLHPDCLEQHQHHLEVSIDYTRALMDYYLISAEAVTARMTQQVTEDHN